MAVVERRWHRVRSMSCSPREQVSLLDVSAGAPRPALGLDPLGGKLETLAT